MNGFRCAIPVTIRFADCDSLGHVNNAKFFTFMEEARFAWFRTVFGEDGFRLHPIILAEARCAFRSPATHAEVLEVGIRVKRIGRSSFAHEYRIEGEARGPGGEARGPASDRRLVAEGESIGVGFDYERQTSRELGAAFRKAIEEHQQGPVA